MNSSFFPFNFFFPFLRKLQPCSRLSYSEAVKTAFAILSTRKQPNTLSRNTTCLITFAKLFLCYFSTGFSIHKTIAHLETQAIKALAVPRKGTRGPSHVRDSSLLLFWLSVPWVTVWVVQKQLNRLQQTALCGGGRHPAALWPSSSEPASQQTRGGCVCFPLCTWTHHRGLWQPWAPPHLRVIPHQAPAAAAKAVLESVVSSSIFKTFNSTELISQSSLPCFWKNSHLSTVQ